MPEEELKEVSARINEQWGDRIEGALMYAIDGCQTAPPEFCQVSADFF